MAETTETVETGVTDRELFSEALTEEPKEQPRDDKGRFAKDETEAAPVEPQSPEPAKDTDAAPIQPPPDPSTRAQEKDEANVPSWRLREEREQRETAQRRADEEARRSYALNAQLQALQQQVERLQQPKQEPVDFFADPQAALKQSLDPITQQFGQTIADLQRELSETRAIAKYGREAYEAMETELQKAMAAGDPEVYQLRNAALSSRDPAGVAMQWYRQRSVLTKVGDDPEKWFEKQLDERLKNQEYQGKLLDRIRGTAQSANTGRPAISLPPSINRLPGSGTSVNTDDADMSDAALFRHAVNNPRR